MTASGTGDLPHALVFDFDGLIVDTETSIYEMARDTFATFGIDLTVAAWATVVGRSGHDECAVICDTFGWDVDAEEWWVRYKAIDRSFRDHLPVLPGVLPLLEACAAASVPTGVASSSSSDWIHGFLERLGLRHLFATVAGFDRTGASKPAPDAYLLACADLGADPARSVALEDSAPGIASAKAAGLLVVAVPGAITRHTDLSAADLHATSLEEIHLERLTAALGQR